MSTTAVLRKLEDLIKVKMIDLIEREGVRLVKLYYHCDTERGHVILQWCCPFDGLRETWCRCDAPRNRIDQCKSVPQAIVANVRFHYESAKARKDGHST